MRRNYLLVLLAIAALVAMVACGGSGKEAVTENPLKKAVVGEFIEYKMVTETMGNKMEMTMKQTVVAKDETSVTLRTETTAMGQKMPPTDVKIPLDQPYEPYKAGLTDAKVTPMGEGSETISAGGKSYDCHWAKVKVAASSPTPVESETTVWTSDQVPVNGVVKMVSDSSTKVNGQDMKTKMTMELVSAGK